MDHAVVANLSEMVEEIEQHSGVHYLKIVGRE